MNLSPDIADPPPCPLTGASGSLLLETISPKLLTDLWRYGASVDPSPLHRAAPRIGLWRAPSGLVFFHPAEPGSEAFYRSFYRRFDAYGLLGRQARQRADFQAGAALVRPGHRVLDVGCGEGYFAALVPAAEYVGLDPNVEAPPGGPRVLRETLAAHAVRQPGHYDVVCGFQVIEHVADPLAMARDMVRCLRPGGMLVLAMPFAGSALADIPNNLINLPPHHLSWWSDDAAHALAKQLGLVVEQVGPLPPGGPDALVNQVARLIPRRFRPGRFVQAGLGCHLATLFAFVLGRLLTRCFGMPRGARPVGMLLAARKPA
jgi:SAM-dependent methyltransferase